MTDFAMTKSPTSIRPPMRGGIGLLAWFSLRRQRRDLARLSPEQLDDIGVSAADALTESRRFSWDLPSHWMR